MARYIYLVRHGSYRSGNGLNELGVQQAQFARDYFQGIPVSALYSSMLQRAVETAEIIGTLFPKLEIQTTRLLNESIPTVPLDMREYVAEARPDLTPAKVEENRARADDAFERFFQPSSPAQDMHEVIVSHGNLIRYLVCRALRVDTNAWRHMRPYHCGISRFVINKMHGAVMISFNEMGHIPRDLWTEV